MECASCEICGGLTEPVFGEWNAWKIVLWYCPACGAQTKPVGREWRYTLDDWTDEQDQAKREGRTPGGGER